MRSNQRGPEGHIGQGIVAAQELGRIAEDLKRWLKIGLVGAGVYATLALSDYAFGAATMLPEPPTIKGPQRTYRVVLGHNGSTSYGTIMRGQWASGAVGSICSNCQMPSPEQLNDEAWMALHLLYQTADPNLVASSGLVCEPNMAPMILSVRKPIFHKVGLYYGRVRIGCAG